jgi:hypothetical protein
MLKAITLAAAVATAATGFMASTHQAEARDGAIAAGVIGGLAAGAIIGSAASQPRNYYAGPGYVEPAYAPVYGRCYFTREYDGFRYRRVRVCD